MDGAIAFFPLKQTDIKAYWESGKGIEKVDVLKSNIKSAEFKDAVFTLALDYTTISHHVSKTILHYGQEVHEKQMMLHLQNFHIM